jgi:hypothetical protein
MLMINGKDSYRAASSIIKPYLSDAKKEYVNAYVDNLLRKGDQTMPSDSRIPYEKTYINNDTPDNAFILLFVINAILMIFSVVFIAYF